MIALGVERSIGHDPPFAVEIMVDIANKALSPAVNGPTTAVQVLNHLGDTLRLVGSTPLPASSPGSIAERGQVLVPVQRWDSSCPWG